MRLRRHGDRWVEVWRAAGEVDVVGRTEGRTPARQPSSDGASRVSAPVCTTASRSLTAKTSVASIVLHDCQGASDRLQRGYGWAQDLPLLPPSVALLFPGPPALRRPNRSLLDHGHRPLSSRAPAVDDAPFQLLPLIPLGASSAAGAGALGSALPLTGCQMDFGAGAGLPVSR